MKWLSCTFLLGTISVVCALLFHQSVFHDAPLPSPRPACGPERAPFTSESAVERHVRWFATDDGLLTEESMTLGHHRIGVYKGVALKVRAILNLLDERHPNQNGTYTVAQLLQVVNPARTGIWGEDGTVQHDRLHEVMSAVTHTDGRATRADFQPILAQDVDTVATRVYGVLPVSWKAVTSGSIDELVMYFSGHSKDDEWAIDRADMYQFYTDPYAAFRRRC